MTTIGLRIDVDTLRGTRLGVPNLIDLLARHRIRASFFFSVGPDNMGRHLRRLLNPAFLIKMARTRAASLYGWDILLRGTLWPGPVIGRRCAGRIRQAAVAGHEIGLHAWDHHRWQSRIATMDEKTVTEEISRGMEMLEAIIGRPVDCAAAPAWRVTPAALRARENFPFRYNSDCRGRSIFFPVMNSEKLRQPQIPTTLPTYDEVIGSRCTPATYNHYLLERIRPDRLNVLTIHAEAEGIACLAMFADFLEQAGRRHIDFRPLGDLLASRPAGKAAIHRGRVAGRQGWLACQQEGASAED